MANQSDYTVQGNELMLLSCLVRSAETAQDQLLTGWRDTFGLKRVTRSADDRLYFAPDNTLCTVSYQVDEWQSPSFGRWIFFKLDSQIRFASTIVAALGVPAEKGAPKFVMNLNMKPNLSAYNVVLGLRGLHIAANVTATMRRMARAQTEPLLVKDVQAGFAGHRLVFPLSREPIDWSVALFPCFASLWRDSVAQFSPSAEACAYQEEYLSESLAMHARAGTVFDEIFGANWVKQLFHETIHIGS